MPPKRASKSPARKSPAKSPAASKSPAAAKKTPEAKSTPATGAAKGAAKPAAAKAAAPAAAAKVAELKAKAMALKAKAVKLVAGWKPLDWALFALCVLTALGAVYFALRGVPTFTLFKPPPKVGFLSGKAFDLQSKTLAKKAPGSALVAFTYAAAPPRRRAAARIAPRAQFVLRAQATPRRADAALVCAHRSPLTATPLAAQQQVVRPLQRPGAAAAGRAGGAEGHGKIRAARLRQVLRGVRGVRRRGRRGRGHAVDRLVQGRPAAGGLRRRAHEGRLRRVGEGAQGRAVEMRERRGAERGRIGSSEVFIMRPRLAPAHGPDSEGYATVTP